MEWRPSRLRMLRIRSRLARFCRLMSSSSTKPVLLLVDTTRGTPRGVNRRQVIRSAHFETRVAVGESARRSCDVTRRHLQRATSPRPAPPPVIFAPPRYLHLYSPHLIFFLCLWVCGGGAILQTNSNLSLLDLRDLPRDMIPLRGESVVPCSRGGSGFSTEGAIAPRTLSAMKEYKQTRSVLEISHSKGVLSFELQRCLLRRRASQISAGKWEARTPMIVLFKLRDRGAGGATRRAPPFASPCKLKIVP